MSDVELEMVRSRVEKSSNQNLVDLLESIDLILEARIKTMSPPPNSGNSTNGGGGSESFKMGPVLNTAMTSDVTEWIAKSKRMFHEKSKRIYDLLNQAENAITTVATTTTTTSSSTAMKKTTNTKDKSDNDDDDDDDKSSSSSSSDSTSSSDSEENVKTHNQSLGRKRLNGGIPSSSSTHPIGGSSRNRSMANGKPVLKKVKRN